MLTNPGREIDMASQVEPRLITPQDAARILGKARTDKDPKRSILCMARKGLLRSVRVGRNVMIDKKSIDLFIEGRQ